MKLNERSFLRVLSREICSLSEDFLRIMCVIRKEIFPHSASKIHDAYETSFMYVSCALASAELNGRIREIRDFARDFFRRVRVLDGDNVADEGPPPRRLLIVLPFGGCPRGFSGDPSRDPSGDPSGGAPPGSSGPPPRRQTANRHEPPPASPLWCAAPVTLRLCHPHPTPRPPPPFVASIKRTLIPPIPSYRPPKTFPSVQNSISDCDH